MKERLKNLMNRKIKLWPFAALTMALLAVAASGPCSTIGTDTSAPNAVEHQLFTTVTNYIDVPVQLVITNHLTNTVVEFQTNNVGQVITVTNEQILPKYETVTVTNTIPQYQNSVSDQTRAGVNGFASALNYFFPGSGAIAGTGASMLLALWAHLRSGKRQQTAAALSQQMETVLEFIKSLPNGAAYKEAITNFLQSHQMEAGVSDQVLSLIEKQVSNKEAKTAVQEIRNSLEALQQKTATPA